MKTCAVIYNPVSTGYNPKIKDKIYNKLKTKYKTEMVPSKYSGHVLKLIKEANDSDLTLTMGGDGTVGEAFKGYSKIKQESVYSHISTGTTNDLAQSFGLYKNDPEKSLDLILDGKLDTMDMMTVNDKVFAYVSAFGYVTNVPYNTNPKLKKYLGHLGYVYSALPELLKKPKKLKLSYNAFDEEKQVESYIGIISNSKTFGGVDIYQNADINDGLFEVLFLKHVDSKLVLSILRDYLTNNLNISKYENYIDSFSTNKLDINFEDIPQNDLDNDGDKANLCLTENNKTLSYRTHGKVKMLLPKKRR